MKRAGKFAILAVGLLAGLPLLGLVLATVAANTAPGRAAIETLAPRLTGGKVNLAGLSGRFPDALRAGHIAISDRDGVWLTIDQAELDWSPMRLLFGEVRIASLAAAHVEAKRLPISSGGGGLSLPQHIAVRDFHVDRLDLAPGLAGGDSGASLGVTGKLQMTSLDQAAATLNLQRLDGAGSYLLKANLTPTAATALMKVAEPAHGILSNVAGLPDFGPLSLTASLDGPRSAGNLRLTLAAGPLSVQASGTVDLDRQVGTVDLTGNAPAMAPRPDLNWQSAEIDLHLNGAFRSPNGGGHLTIAKLRAGGSALDEVAAQFHGNAGKIGLEAVLSGLRLPGQPEIFAAAPFRIRLDATAGTPGAAHVDFALSHPLLGATGTAEIGSDDTGRMTLNVPSLAPYAEMAGFDVQGHAEMTASLAHRGDETKLEIGGAFGITGGNAAAVALLGDNATLSLSGKMKGEDVVVDAATLDGRTLHLAGKGTEQAGVIDLDWQAALSDLSVLAAKLAGTASAKGHLHGPRDNLAATAQANGSVAAGGFPAEPLSLSFQAQGIPSAPYGTIIAEGRLAGAPLNLAATARRLADGMLELSLDRLQWKSAAGEGKFTLAGGASLPLGRMQLRLGRLADLASLTGLNTDGSIEATLDAVAAQGGPQVHLQADARQLSVAGNSIDRAAIDARVSDPATSRHLALSLNATGLHAGNISGKVRITATGPPDSLALSLASDLRTPQGPATVAAEATARTLQRDLELTGVQAEYAGETLRLLRPARIGLADGLTIGNLRLGLGSGPAVLDLSGRLTPTLALALSAKNLTPALAKPFAPILDGATGTLAVDGQLRGTLTLPEGSLRLTGRRLKVGAGGLGGLPAADIDATVALAQGSARLDARLAAGATTRLQLGGTMQLPEGAPIGLRLTGTADLAILDPMLAPAGRSARGQVAIDLGITGTLSAPRASGAIRLAGGSLQDFVQGVHITDLAGLIQAEGDTLRIARLDGRAGRGTVSVVGTIGAMQPNLPIALTVTARDARPVASDLLTATIDADMTARGELQGTLTVGGEVRVKRAEINIPDSLPQEVAVLNVRRRGARSEPPRPASTRADALALKIVAPQQIFVRGHGLDAEMGGTLDVGGTTAAPVVGGGFTLRRGTFSLAGQNLTFTSGKVAFGGTGLANKLNPSIDFVAQSSANNVTATLSVGGYADAPKIKLSSTPDLPQDEILAQLLFHQSAKQLSPFQLAEIAQALASLSGVVGPMDPLAAVRNRLGLDRLSVGNAATGSGATIQAGKYVANGVYVGTKQGTSGGTQAQVQIDLTKHLKVESTIGTGGTPVTGTTPDNDPGSRLGLTYQFEY